jgi:excisionase family DNA binding protein
MGTQQVGELGFVDTGSIHPEPVWDCVQAARFLRLHPKTVKRMAQAGKIPGCRLGRRWFFRPSDLDALLRPSVSSSLKTRLRRNPTERRQ